MSEHCVLLIVANRHMPLAIRRLGEFPLETTDKETKTRLDSRRSSLLV